MELAIQLLSHRAPAPSRMTLSPEIEQFLQEDVEMVKQERRSVVHNFSDEGDDLALWEAVIIAFVFAAFIYNLYGFATVPRDPEDKDKGGV